MSYRLLYHPAVAAEDLPAIPRNLQRRIALALEHRLTEAPERYGAPLRGTLKGYWKLRVGDYRIVYRIVKKEVWVLAIRHRGTVYAETVSRI